MATILSAKDLATKFETDARTVRKFLRSHLPEGDTPGKGSRYSIEGRQVQGLKKAFTAWDAARTAAKADKIEEVIDEVAPDPAD